MSESWFSASLRLVTKVADTEASREDSVILLRTSGWEAALGKALAIGEQMEQTYTKGDGETVEKLLVGVRTLDELGDEITDGREVYCATVVADDRSFGPARQPIRGPRKPASEVLGAQPTRLRQRSLMNLL